MKIHSNDTHNDDVSYLWAVFMWGCGDAMDALQKLSSKEAVTADLKAQCNIDCIDASDAFLSAEAEKLKGLTGDDLIKAEAKFRILQAQENNKSQIRSDDVQTSANLVSMTNDDCGALTRYANSLKSLLDQMHSLVAMLKT